MSQQVDTALVQQYDENFRLLSQQKTSRFRGAVLVDSDVVGEKKFYDQIGQTAARIRPSRHADSPMMDTPHARRMVTLTTYDWGDMVDNEDKLRMLGDPQGKYTKAGVSAFNRSIDDVIISAALGTAATGKDGTTSVTLPASQKIAHGGTGLTLTKLISSKVLFDANEVDEDTPLFLSLNSKGLEDLLADTTITSADYNTVRALVKGDIDSFMGYKFVKSQRLTQDATPNRQVIAWAETGVQLSIARDIMVRVAERPDKNFANYLFVAMDIGAVRMEEVQIVEIAIVE